LPTGLHHFIFVACADMQILVRAVLFRNTLWGVHSCSWWAISYWYRSGV